MENEDIIMKVITYLCDKCGKEIKKNQIYTAKIYEGLDEGIHNGVYESVHLCENCAKQFLKWLKEYE